MDSAATEIYTLSLHGGLSIGGGGGRGERVGGEGGGWEGGVEAEGGGEEEYMYAQRVKITCVRMKDPL